MSRGTTGQGGVRTGGCTNAGSAYNGKIGCGEAEAPIASEEEVAFLRLWKAGRNVVEKKCIIISMSMNAGGRRQCIDLNTKLNTLPDGRWNAAVESDSELFVLLGSISGFARQGVGIPVVQSTRPTVMMMVATIATTTVGKGRR